jgi:hypothetical protein
MVAPNAVEVAVTADGGTQRGGGGRRSRMEVPRCGGVSWHAYLGAVALARW